MPKDHSVVVEQFVMSDSSYSQSENVLIPHKYIKISYFLSRLTGRMEPKPFSHSGVNTRKGSVQVSAHPPHQY